MDEKQYLKMRAKADEEYRKNLEAIDRVWHMSHPDKDTPAPKSSGSSFSSSAPHTLNTGSSGMVSNGHKPFVLSEAAKRVIAEMPDNAEVSQPIILRKLLDRYPEIRPRVEKDQIKAQVAGLLSRMAKNNKLARVREAHGSEPGVFKKLPPPLSSED